MAVKNQLIKVLNSRWYFLAIALLMLGLAVLIARMSSTYSTEKELASTLNDYVKNAQNNFEQIADQLHEATSADAILSKEKFLAIAASEKFFLYEFELAASGQLEISNWSSNVVLPNDSILLSNNSVGYAKLANGHYVFLKENFKNHILVALLPIKWNYFVTNKYLKNNFLVGNNLIAKKFDISIDKSKGTEVNDASGKELFRISTISKQAGSFLSYTSIFLFIAGLLFLYVYFNQCIIDLDKDHQTKTALLLNAVAFFLLRVTLYFIPNFIGLTDFAFFNRSQFQGAWLHHSMGDWLANLLLIIWLISSVNNLLTNKQLFKEQNQLLPAWTKVVIKALLATILSFSTVILITNLVSNKQVSFDVLNVFSLDFFTVIAFVIIVGSVYIIYQINFWAIKRIEASFLNILVFMFTATLCLLILISIRFNLLLVREDMLVAAWLLLFQILLFTTYKSKWKPGALKLGWLFFFAISSALFVLHYQQQTEIEQRRLYASRLTAKASPVTEMMLSTITSEIDRDFNEQVFLKFYNGDNIDDSQAILNISYNDRYSYKMFLFNDQGKSLQDSSTYNFAEISSIIATQANSTFVPNLYMYESTSYQSDYLYKKEIIDTAKTLIGYAFFQIIPRNNANSGLYPELFNKQVSKDFSMLNNYALAIYNNDKIVHNENEFPFPTILPSTIFGSQQEKIIKENGYSQLWQTSGAGKAVVIVKKNNSWLSFITLFSYLFTIMLLLGGIGLLIRFLFNTSLSTKTLRSNFSFNIAERIQGAVVLLSVASFFIIGFVTILFFVSRAREANQKKLSTTLDIVVNQLNNALELENQRGNLYDSAISSLDSSSIYRIFSNIAESNGIELNLFDANAQLQFSTLPLPYSKQLTSGKMDPYAYLNLFNRRAVQFYQNENIGTLKYLSAYRALLNANGETYGFLQSPFFRSEVALRNDISDFLVAMINLIVFIFLLSGLVAIFVTNKITNAFSLIGEKMKMITLGKSNQAISWKGNDEISTLIQQYNSMLSQLEESAVILAKQEREYAWQEMAKQVAHEIKNPLTPMKLSIQFLQRAIESDSPNVKELSASTAKTIINQIDHLSSMAGEFSQFAQIGNAKPAKLHLQKVLIFLKQLYEASSTAVLDWQIEDRPIYIMSDETYINRLFTNLLQNAIQAGKEGTIVKIAVKAYSKNGNAIITVADSGTGIPESLWPKIFVPNFTTKSSGTGLGLAMSKRIAEQAGGDISFTSNSSGTIFTVILPLVY